MRFLHSNSYLGPQGVLSSTLFWGMFCTIYSAKTATIVNLWYTYDYVWKVHFMRVVIYGTMPDLNLLNPYEFINCEWTVELVSKVVKLI